ncbi:hypothetical protein [Arthrobacter nitrophenolicus]
MPDLQALALVCTLTPSPEPSSSEVMARHILDEFEHQASRCPRSGWWTTT